MKKAGLFLFGICLSQLLTGQTEKKHSITAYSGVEFYNFTPVFNIVGTDLQVAYNQGDAMRIPVGLKYFYNIKSRHSVGIDLTAGYRGIGMEPSFKDSMFGWTGPAVSATGTVYSADLNYKIHHNIGAFEVSISTGPGMFLMPKEKTTNSPDFRWYRNAYENFYPFAQYTYENTIRRAVPTWAVTIGGKFKGFDFGFSYRSTLVSPIKDFAYNGTLYKQKSALSARFIHIGYCFRF